MGKDTKNFQDSCVCAKKRLWKIFMKYYRQIQQIVNFALQQCNAILSDKKKISPKLQMFT